MKRTEENKTELPESPRRRRTVIAALAAAASSRYQTNRPTTVTARCALTPVSLAPGRVVTHPPRAETTHTALLVSPVASKLWSVM